MTFKAVIFDFNGTLFWDTPYHNQAWDQFLKKHDIVLSDSEKMQKIHGKPNKDILSGVFNKTFTESEYVEMSDVKETLYQDICRHNKLEYAHGATTFITWLKNNRIKYAIATSSAKGNIDFYLKYMDLGSLINPENIVFDDGSLKGKPNPDIFLKAMEKIKCKPGEVVIFEDSMAGIKAAKNAKAGKIIIVNSNDDDYRRFDYQVIRSFNEVDLGLFNC